MIWWGRWDFTLLFRGVNLLPPLSRRAVSSGLEASLSGVIGTTLVLLASGSDSHLVMNTQKEGERQKCMSPNYC